MGGPPIWPHLNASMHLLNVFVAGPGVGSAGEFSTNLGAARAFANLVNCVLLLFICFWVSAQVLQKSRLSP